MKNPRYNAKTEAALQETRDIISGKVQAKHYSSVHALTSNYLGFRECHIQPDWLLIYAIDNGILILTASRTGTHSDLFR